MSAERDAAARAFYEDTGEHGNGAFEAGWDAAVRADGRPLQIVRYRGRQSGKTHEAAQVVSRISGLTVETCTELMQSGYTFSRNRDSASGWTKP